YLQLLLGAVALVLLVSCVNIASAVLARASTRGRELAVRVALGAGRARLVRQLLTESLVLALAGGAAGFALALLLVRAVLRLAPSSIPRVAEIGVSWEVALFALAVSAATGLLVGVVPAVQSTGLPPSLALGAGGRGAVGDRRGRLRGALVGVEVALALVLLAGAGLLIRSLARLMSQDPGFAPRGVLVARVVLPSSRYAGGPARRRFYDELLPTLRALPGVAAAGATNAPPLVWGPNGGLAVEGREESAQAHYRVVSPELMRALGVPLLRGRPLEARDDSAASHAALVNAAFAARVWPGVDAVGRRIRFLGMDAHNDVWLTVVGVVGDMRQIALESAPAPEVYVSYRQRPERAGAMSIVIRTSGAPAALAPAVRAAVRARDPLVPVELTTMDERVRRSVADRRFVMLVLAAFGAVALVLAAAGIYGVLSYTVARRTREIGVRVALGAQRGTVLAMVLRDAMRPVLAGAAAGAVAALLLGRLMRGLVYGVGVADPVALGLAAALLLAVALAASWMPAHRAARVDPLTALRVD
ncbi:MAG TPA: FtsX-like permease family protein, partial [Gemmatimonadaceae bacterium]|nr:FtsX-like permease family protein [Gemmatimonadaceae bacterium]